MNLPQDLPIVIVGAGAAGLMAAIFASDATRRVCLLERTNDGGRKILISGGGRCNILPDDMTSNQFVTTSSRNSLRKLLSSWPLQDQRNFFEQEVGIQLRLELETGKWFPVSNRAHDVRDGLIDLARTRRVEIRTNSVVTDVIPMPVGWCVHLKNEEKLHARAVILASGGLSVPNTGSDGSGLDIAKRLGHTIHPLYPALTPLTADSPRYRQLAGVSLRVVLKAPTRQGEFRSSGGFLFTHRGFSGPAVLDASHLAVQSRLQGGERQALLVQWCETGTEEWDALLRSSPSLVTALLRRVLPIRLVEVLLEESGVPSQRRASQLRREERARLLAVLTNYPLPWTGDEGYRKAEVTGGGVSLEEVNPHTLESRRHRGLYLCGEMLDAFGPIGGYNFAWAWQTGRAAGRGAAQCPSD